MKVGDTVKIWKKIFLYSIILFIILFNGAGVVIIENIYNRNLENTIVSYINEYKSIRNSIYLNADLLSRHSPDILLSVIKNYIYGDISGVKNIEIFDKKNNIILNAKNLGITSYREEVQKASIKECKFIIREIEGKRLLFIGSTFKVDSETYKLIITKDINFISEERSKNYELFILLSLVVTVLLAIGMYIISKNITNPIIDLINVSNSITKGDYSKRAKEYNNDEIGILSKNFNRMMKEIEDKIKELNIINEQKQRFIDNLTHEMKTPITSIIGYSDLLLKGNISEEIRLKSLDYINSQGRRLENLSTSLIKLIMIRNKQVENQKELSFIKDITIDAIKSIEYKLKNKLMNIVVDVENSKVYGDKQLTILLITNILDNSIKASEYKSKIIIRGEAFNSSRYKLKIVDEGFGISKDDLDKVIEPFYMVDKSRAKVSKNLGLGLAICQEICISNNIEFYIESELSKGTTVTLILNMENTKDEN